MATQGLRDRYLINSLSMKKRSPLPDGGASTLGAMRKDARKDPRDRSEWMIAAIFSLSNMCAITWVRSSLLEIHLWGPAVTDGTLGRGQEMQGHSARVKRPVFLSMG